MQRLLAFRHNDTVGTQRISDDRERQPTCNIRCCSTAW